MTKITKNTSDSAPWQTEVQNESGQCVTDVRAAVDETVDVISKRFTLKIADIAAQLGLNEVEKNLPNGRVIKTIEWSPAHLNDVFSYVSELCQSEGLGKSDTVIVDGAGPGWLIVAISHACHPVPTAVRYPQAGPEATLPLSGTPQKLEGSADNLSFEVESDKTKTLITFKLDTPQIDVQAALSSLVAPVAEVGKPVYISGRGPIAITASLAEAYAHSVPYVASFQPGVGYVVCISHDESHPIGTVL